jgi:hypothetical protein
MYSRIFRVSTGFANTVRYYRVPLDKVAECEADYAYFADTNPGGSAGWLADHAQSRAYVPGVAVDWADRDW